MRGDGELLILVRDQGPGIAGASWRRCSSPSCAWMKPATPSLAAWDWGSPSPAPWCTSTAVSSAFTIAREGAGGADQPAL